MPTFGSLFAGIGGIDLGLERAGWTGRFQVEIDPFCRRVLAKHWPDVTRYGDITEVDWTTVEQVDLLAGGFPCQPFSFAGKRKGTLDDRWLWPEFARAIRVLRPRYVLVENVPGLLAGHGGMGELLRDLAALGYDAEWDSIPAAAVGAPHLRYRVWIVAHRTCDAPCTDPDCQRPHRAGIDLLGDAELRDEQVGVPRSVGATQAGSELTGLLADPDDRGPFDTFRAGRDAARNGGQDVSDTNGLRLEGERSGGLLLAGPSLGYDVDGCGRALADADGGDQPEVQARDAALDVERQAERRRDVIPAGSGAGGRTLDGHPAARVPRRRDAARACGPVLADAASLGQREPTDEADTLPASGRAWVVAGGGSWWATEPDVGRVAHGVPARVDRLRALGNAVVPQVVEVIGRRLLEVIEP